MTDEIAEIAETFVAEFNAKSREMDAWRDAFSTKLQRAGFNASVGANMRLVMRPMRPSSGWAAYFPPQPERVPMAVTTAGSPPATATVKATAPRKAKKATRRKAVRS